MVTDVEHLERLAAALDAAGWTVGRRHEGTPLVRVSSPKAPHIGDSVRVKDGVGGVPWFVSSCGDPVAPCHDVRRACAEVGELLELFGAAQGA
ncbi:hypothetical protein [Actinomadura violacea]|uniref:Uncharacterized protein n=1 Tax=Actinomadura violacea TaxID=2819934 RepID=A0ABS3RH68_9ACTN|nr:hypothetical protein [Actinomadura violacea]MBO2456075.1 hypothetical protein [Actinomadura violacea]